MAIRNHQYAIGLAVLALIVCGVHGTKKALVLVDSPDIKTTHSIFFKSLKGKLCILVQATRTLF